MSAHPVLAPESGHASHPNARGSEEATQAAEIGTQRSGSFI
jgi:hypothetical protein